MSARRWLATEWALCSRRERERSFDTHESILLKGGTYEIRRQREYTPEGWRRVED